MSEVETLVFKPAQNAITLHLQDCVAGMRERLSDGSVDVVVTSPPYNLGIDYEGYDDTQTREEYLKWCCEWGAELCRVLSDDGSFFLNVGSKPSDPLVPFQLLNVMLQHFKLQNVIHWVKSIAILKTEVGKYPGVVKDVVVGHYKPIAGKRYLNDCHEYVFHLTKTGNTPLDRLAVGVPYQDRSNIARWAKSGKGVHCRGNTWFIPYKTILSRSKERPHPATFPIELPTRCIRLHGVDRVRLVMDPFLGIGSTAVACSRMKLGFVGFEIAQDYFEYSGERVREEIAGASGYLQGLDT